MAEAETFDAAKFAAWADEVLPELGAGPVHCTILTGGASNIVMRVERDGAPMVLRRPPRTPRPDSLKIIGREARVLAALGATDVPHPRFRRACEDASVIGAPFYVMDWVDGFVGYPLERLPAPYDRAGGARSSLAFALVDGIARLANVDYRAVGLDDFGKPEGFLERQASRWMAQLASYKESEGYEPRDIPGLAYVADWLAANTPPMSKPGIIHGDYSLANAMFHHGAPARLAAMIDWELATIGDPLLDLGWVLYAYRGRDERSPPAGYFDASDFPYREALADYYAERTGRSIEHLTYYMVLAQFKLGVIMERQYARILNGRQTMDVAGDAGAFVARLIGKAYAMARGEA
ncbi:MAG: phosphotransferase family protein [Hydrogenophilaceae bacterium]|jgi:aminoglycoside phosphotransferase (APT) family kinase protein|nr:phosphotransferase family protein [Hydrogenophilaceae bacterium]